MQSSHRTVSTATEVDTEDAALLLDPLPPFEDDGDLSDLGDLPEDDSDTPEHSGIKSAANARSALDSLGADQGCSRFGLWPLIGVLFLVIVGAFAFSPAWPFASPSAPLDPLDASPPVAGLPIGGDVLSSSSPAPDATKDVPQTTPGASKAAAVIPVATSTAAELPGAVARATTAPPPPAAVPSTSTAAPAVAVGASRRPYTGAVPLFSLANVAKWDFSAADIGTYALLVADEANLLDATVAAETAAKLAAVAGERGFGAVGAYTYFNDTRFTQRLCVSLDMPEPWTLVESNLYLPDVDDDAVAGQALKCQVVSLPLVVLTEDLKEEFKTQGAETPFSLDSLFWGLWQKARPVRLLLTTGLAKGGGRDTPGVGNDGLRFDLTVEPGSGSGREAIIPGYDPVSVDAFVRRTDLRTIRRTPDHRVNGPVIGSVAFDEFMPGEERLDPHSLKVETLRQWEKLPAVSSRGLVEHYGCSATTTRCSSKWQSLGWSMPPCCEAVLASLVIAASTLLTEHNIRNWIACGTVIGSMKTGGVLPWDNDAEIYVDLRDLVRGAELKEQFKEKGMTLYVYKSAPQMTVVWTGNNAWQVELGTHYHPEIYPMRMASFYGVRLPVPDLVHRYLTERYGNTWNLNIPHIKTSGYDGCEKQDHSWNCVSRRLGLHPGYKYPVSFGDPRNTDHMIHLPDGWKTRDDKSKTTLLDVSPPNARQTVVLEKIVSRLAVANISVEWGRPSLLEDSPIGNNAE